MRTNDERIIAALIIGIGLALSLVWVFRMPLFQSPDENAHADYAFTLFSVHAPLRARDARPATDVHPTIRYLEDHSGFRTIRFNPDGRVPAGFGSAEYFRQLDRGAPRVSVDFLRRDGERVPWIAQQYAYLYYALDAVAIGVAALASGGSAVAEFFGARLFNVVLLGVTLWLTWRTLVELGGHPMLRIATLAIVAWFPLTSWVSAYVQPDNLTFTAVALVFYLALRLRREPDALRAALWLGLALGLLALTKPQYFVAAALPAIGDRTLRSASHLRSAGDWAKYLALVAGPPIVCGCSALWFSSGADQQVGAIVAANANPLGVMWSHGLPAFAGYVAEQIANACRTTFFYGLPFVSYWGMISWTGYRFEFGPFTDFVFTLIGLLSQAIAILMAVRAVIVWRRLANVARRRSSFWALHLLASDVALNGYFVFGVLIFALSLATGGQLGVQGRYWLPFILPSVMCATRYAPHVFRRARTRRVLSLAFTLGLLLYSGVGTFAGFAALDARFYRPPVALNNVEYQARITRVGPYNLYEPHEEPLRLAFGKSVPVDGWAINSRLGRPARSVMILIDGRSIGDFLDECGRVQCSTDARYGLARRDVVDRLHDDDLLNTGFSAAIEPAVLPPGPHTLSLQLREEGRRFFSRSVVRVLVEGR